MRRLLILGAVASVACVALTAISVAATRAPAAPHWTISRPYVERHAGELTDLSCPTDSFCLGVGSGTGRRGFVESYVEVQRVGTRSVEPFAVAGVHSPVLRAVSCASSTSCVAVGYKNTPVHSLLAARWNGSGWTPIRLAAKGLEFDSVSCASTTSCIAVGNRATTSSTTSSATVAVQITGDTGQRSIVGSTYENGVLTGVSCDAATDCEAVGYATYDPNHDTTGIVEHWDGSTWTEDTSGDIDPAGGDVRFTGVSCVAVATCSVIGTDTAGGTGRNYVAEDLAGGNWQVNVLPTSTDDPVWDSGRLSCVDATHCAGLAYHHPFSTSHYANELLVRDSSGWRLTRPLTESTGAVLDEPLHSIVCRTGGCDIAGKRVVDRQWHPAVVTYREGVAQIASLPAPLRAQDLDLGAVSCAGPTCLAVGQAVIHRAHSSAAVPHVLHRRPGGRWATMRGPSGIGYVNDVSCAAARSCMELGRQSYADKTALAAVWNGRWHRVQPTKDITTLSCATANFCAGINNDPGADGDLSVAQIWHRGHGWMAAALPGGNVTPSDVSCTSASFCLAVGIAALDGHGHSYAARWNGSHWLRVAAPGTKGLSSVSCTSATLCAGTLNGRVVLRNGASWHAIGSPSGTNAAVAAVHCRSASSCTAVGRQGKSGGATLIAHWNGKTWTRESPSVPGQLTSLSCTTSRCDAVGSAAQGSITAPLVAEGTG